MRMCARNDVLSGKGDLMRLHNCGSDALKLNNLNDKKESI